MDSRLISLLVGAYITAQYAVRHFT